MLLLLCRFAIDVSEEGSIDDKVIIDKGRPKCFDELICIFMLCFVSAPPREQAEKTKGGRESCFGLDEQGNHLGDITLGFFLRQVTILYNSEPRHRCPHLECFLRLLIFVMPPLCLHSDRISYIVKRSV